MGLMVQQAIKNMTSDQKKDVPDISLDDLMNAFSGDDGSRGLKLVLAKQFGNIEDEFSGATVLISERNRAALHVMRDQIKAGKKNLAIFYGAGHMPDMTERLEDMGFTRGKTEWETAWNIKPTSTDQDNQNNGNGDNK
jgi:hypothetical protein